MTAKSRWLYGAVLLLILAWEWTKITKAAFSAPWHWTSDQILLLTLAVGLAYLVGVWAYTWASGGRAAVKARWEKVRWPPEFPKNKKVFCMQMGFWIVVGVVLVFIFNMTGH